MNKLLFFGNERLATGLSTTAPALQALVAVGYEIAGVVVAQSDIGSSRSARELEIVQVANQYDIPVLSPAKLNDIAGDLASMQAMAGVLVAYGKIVPQSIIDIFPKGIINIHPSLLPKHRGPTPIESVILDGDKQTGVSLMQLAAKMDAGPVYAQQTIDLNGDETKQELAAKLQLLGSEMLIAHLPAIIDGSLRPESQNDAQATYDELINKADGLLDFTKTATELERRIKAYAGWPRSRTTIANTEVIITSAHKAEGSGNPGSLYLEDKQFGIHCSKGILIIETLIPAGKKEMPASAFMAGYTIN